VIKCYRAKLSPRGEGGPATVLRSPEGVWRCFECDIEAQENGFEKVCAHIISGMARYWGTLQQDEVEWEEP